jgi:hypothetical protein
MKTRTVLYADEGKILTDGELYGKTIYLAETKSADDFYEIDEAEYEAIMKAKEEEELAILENE